MPSYRIVIVGWDGATWDLLRPWVDAGQLPSLGRMLAEGAAGELRSTIPPTTAQAWASMTTGTNPGKHGLMDWITRRRGGYQSMPVTANLCTQKSIWELLSEAGRRVFTFNVPMTFPPRPLNGLVVAGLGTPTVESEFTYPPGLYCEIVEAVGDYVLYPNPGHPDSVKRVESFLERLYHVTDVHFRALDHLLARETWDSWMAVVSGTDAVQHVLWKYLDPHHRQHDPRLRERFAGEALRYFQYVDTHLGRILDALDSNTVLFLTSDHGFGPLNQWFHVNTWLLQQGYIVLKKGVWPRLKRLLFRAGLTPMNVYGLLRTLGLGQLKQEVVAGRGKGRLRALMPLAFLSFADVDWSRSRAYALGQTGPIYFNLKGREPQGIVTLGDEAEALRREVVERLRRVSDPQTGEPIVGEIYRPEEIYAGPHVVQAADIVFTARFDARRGQIPGFGEADFASNRIIAPMDRGISGVHRMNGLVLAYGAPIKSGVWLEGAQIADVAPTALHLAGLPIPEDMDGRVLLEALQGELACAASIRYGPPAARVAEDREGILSAEDEAVIQERLRGLGYAA